MAWSTLWCVLALTIAHGYSVPDQDDNALLQKRSKQDFMTKTTETSKKCMECCQACIGKKPRRVVRQCKKDCSGTTPQLWASETGQCIAGHIDEGKKCTGPRKKCKQCCQTGCAEHKTTCRQRCRGKGPWEGAPQRWADWNKVCQPVDDNSCVPVVIETTSAFTESVVAGHFRFSNNEEEAKYYIASDVEASGGLGKLQVYDSHGTIKDGLNSSPILGNAGLAMDAENKLLYVAVRGAIQVFDFTDFLDFDEAVKTIDLKNVDGTNYEDDVNGLCLSSDGEWLYATDPGYEGGNDLEIKAKEGKTPHLWAINLGSDEVTPLLIEDRHSPNGCAVDPVNPDLVYLACFWHGLTAFHRTSGTVYLNFGANIKEDTQANHRAGDGIVYYDGRLYMTSFRMNIDFKWDGNLWSCDPEGSQDCEVVAATHGADIQLDTTDPNRVYILLPEFGEFGQNFVQGDGQVRRFRPLTR